MQLTEIPLCVQLDGRAAAVVDERNGRIAKRTISPEMDNVDSFLAVLDNGAACRFRIFIPFWAESYDSCYFSCGFRKVRW